MPTLTLPTLTLPTLTVCLIAKNEEAHLARCLASVRGLADDIVLVDTGSTDRTPEIARAAGARVFHVPWQDDFSLARNFSLEQATGDWILVLDADESIAARDHVHIRALLARNDLNAVVSAQRHYLTSGTVIGWQPGPGGYEEGKPYPGYVDVDCRRLFRNLPWLRFRNRVHEELVSTQPARPVAQVRAEWVIHHFGKAGDHTRLRAKGEAYLRIGRKKIEDRPDDPQAHYELGIQHAELGDSSSALACFERARALSPGFRDSQLRRAICHRRLGQYQKALAGLRRAARTLPQCAAEIALEAANVHRALGDEAAVERTLRRAAAAHPAFVPASVNLALCYQRQHRPAEALESVDRALEHCPGHVESLRLRARILCQQRRFEDARACLELMSGPADAEVSSLRGAVALGLGEVNEAIAELRLSLDQQPTHEATVNLSTALTAQGRFRRTARRDSSWPFTLFFYLPRSIPFDARTPRTRGLGGTESAIVYLAEALARLGHSIVVFNQCDEPGTWAGVEYARWETMPVRAVDDRPDVLVAVRHWELIGQARFAPLQIFWTGDAFDQPFLENLADPKARREIDYFMLQSDWQATTFQAHHDLPPSTIVRTRLGAAASAVDSPVRPQTTAARPRRLAYASTPFRGLDLLLDLFPRIRAACPDAELDVFSSMKVYGVTDEADEEQFGALYRKADQPGVRLIGSLPQLELAQRLQQVRVLAYPNHYRETFCIAAIEAQAAGCAVVTSALGALPETVGDGGICIADDPQTSSYQQRFVDECVRLLNDDERWQAMSERGLARAWTDYTWTAIAADWDTFCRAALTIDAQVLERITVHIAAGRTGLAQRMLERELPGGVSGLTPSRFASFLQSSPAARPCPPCPAP